MKQQSFQDMKVGGQILGLQRKGALP